MKKCKLSVTLMGLVLLTSGNKSFAQCYTAATSTAQVVSTTITGPAPTTGCDMLDYRGDTYAVFTWADANNESYFAWQVNGGAITEIKLNYRYGSIPDVAITSIRTTNNGDAIYAVVAYVNSGNGYAMWDIYKWTGIAFTLYSTNTTNEVVNTAIHVDGDSSGIVALVWDDFNNNTIIRFTGGNIEDAPFFPMYIDNAPKTLGNATGIPVFSGSFSYPDVAITAVAPDTSMICFSWQEFDGFSDYYVLGFGWRSDMIYTAGSTHTNISTLPIAGINDQFYEYNSTNVIGKTSISMTDRHSNTYKYQPQIAWQERDGGSSLDYIKAEAVYWDGQSATPVPALNTTPVTMTNLTGQINTEIHTGVQVISSMVGDYMIVGWDFSDLASSCLTNNKIEPITAPAIYNKSLISPAVTAMGSTYLGIGEPLQHGNNSNNPSDELIALSMAGKQSANMLYFYYDVDSNKLYSKTVAPNASPLRMQPGNIGSSGSSSQTMLVPNPVTADLTLTLPDMKQAYQLSLIDLTGKEVLRLTGSQSDLQSDLRKSISAIASGTYLLQVNGEGFNKTQLINK